MSARGLYHDVGVVGALVVALGAAARAAEAAEPALPAALVRVHDGPAGGTETHAGGLRLRPGRRVLDDLARTVSHPGRRAGGGRAPRDRESRPTTGRRSAR